jgi:hypothetical protein
MGDSLASLASCLVRLNSGYSTTARSFLFRSFFNLSVPMSVVGIPLASESHFILGTMDIVIGGQDENLRFVSRAERGSR